MWGKVYIKTERYAASAVLAAGIALTGQQGVALSAQEVLDNMSAEQHTAYVSGVVNGLAYARWLAEDRDDSGMLCIYDWYYKTDQRERFNERMDWFERHPDQQVSVLMYALIREYCGAQGSGGG